MHCTFKAIFLLLLSILPLSAQESTVVAAGEMESSSPTAELFRLSEGKMRFKNPDNTVDSMWVLNKNELNPSTNTFIKGDASVLTIPGGTVAPGDYTVTFSVMPWRIREQNTPVSGLEVSVNGQAENLTILSSSEDTMLNDRGICFGDGKWQEIPMSASVTVKKDEPIAVSIDFAGGQGNYIGVMLSQLAFKPTK